MRNRLPILYRFLLYFVLFAIILTGSLYMLQRTLLPSYYYSQTVGSINEEIIDLDNLINNDDISYVFDTLVANYEQTVVSEITVYSPSGSVLYNHDAAPLTPLILSRLESAPIEQTVFDGRMTFLVIYVQTDSYIYRFKTPYESLETALAIINSLYGITLLLALVISVGLGYLFSRSVSRPLQKLDRIASKMATLDFSVTFEDKRTDEIGRLGRTLNQLTKELKETIGMLESELMKEKQLVQMRKTFVSNVSHEMQTPLAVILGNLEALEDGLYDNDEDRDEHTRRIGLEAAKMSRLVSDMLDLAQLESGLFRIDEYPFDYLEILENVISTFRSLKKDEDIRLDLKCSVSHTTINGDAGRIEQLLNNLLTNAYTHAKKGSAITIKITESNEGLLTEVHNQGQKIPEEMLEEIFMSFHKGKNKQTGTGLGLAIARQIIRLHDGDLNARNTDDGVTFFFTIPLFSHDPVVKSSSR